MAVPQRAQTEAQQYAGLFREGVELSIGTYETPVVSLGTGFERIRRPAYAMEDHVENVIRYQVGPLYRQLRAQTNQTVQNIANGIRVLLIPKLKRQPHLEGEAFGEGLQSLQRVGLVLERVLARHNL